MAEPLSLPQARALADAALAGPRTAPDRRIAVAVCDRGGHPLVVLREADAPPLLAHIALAKAFTCVAYGKPTAELADLAAEWGPWFDGISRVALARMGSPLTAAKGGVFIQAADGTVLGAVGVAGETGDRDEALARLGLDALRRLEP